MDFVHIGRGTEEHKCDPGEKPSSWSGVVRAGGAVLCSRLIGTSAAAPLRTYCHCRVPRSNRGQTSFHTTGVQQGVLNFLQAVNPRMQYNERSFKHVPVCENCSSNMCRCIWSGRLWACLWQPNKNKSQVTFKP